MVVVVGRSAERRQHFFAEQLQRGEVVLIVAGVAVSGARSHVHDLYVVAIQLVLTTLQFFYAFVGSARHRAAATNRGELLRSGGVGREVRQARPLLPVVLE